MTIVIITGMSQRDSCFICGCGPRWSGHKHDPSGVVFMSFVHAIFWGIPAAVMAYVAIMFVVAVITGEPVF